MAKLIPPCNRYTGATVGITILTALIVGSLVALAWAILIQIDYEKCEDRKDDEERDLVRYHDGIQFMQYKRRECIENCQGVPCNDCCPECTTYLGTLVVRGNNVTISDGDTTPSLADHTDFGSVLLAASASRNFTLTNAGAAPLRVLGNTVESGPGIRLLGDGASGRFVVEDVVGVDWIGQSFVISPGASVFLTVEFFANAPVGNYMETVQIASTGSGTPVYDFVVGASIATPTPTPTPTP